MRTMTYYGRYGKFLMLQFNASGRLVGARVNTYLLEKASTWLAVTLVTGQLLAAF